MVEPDEFTLVRDTLIRQEQIRNHVAKGGMGAEGSLMILENQREILACLATIARGGTLPFSIAKDLRERAQRITKILEGG